MNYIEVANTLTNRIAALGPRVLATIDSPSDLFKVPGFRCDDLNPSLAQASFALAKARAIVAAPETPDRTQETTPCEAATLRISPATRE